MKKKPKTKTQKLLDDIAALRKEIRRAERSLRESNERAARDFAPIIQSCYSAVEEARKYASFIEHELFYAYKSLPKYKRVPVELLVKRFNAEKDGIDADMTDFKHLCP